MILTPYAYSKEKRVVLPSQATKQTDYKCPRCGGRLRLRGGETESGLARIVAHYYHVDGNTCMGEAHEWAQKWLLDVLASHPGYLSFAIAERENSEWMVRLPDYDDVQLEIRVPHRSDTKQYYRADVALLLKGEPVFAFEIVDTHAMDDEKQKGMSVAWVEIDANAVCEQKQWLVTNASWLRNTNGNYLNVLTREITPKVDWHWRPKEVHEIPLPKDDPIPKRRSPNHWSESFRTREEYDSAIKRAKLMNMSIARYMGWDKRDIEDEWT